MKKILALIAFLVVISCNPIDPTHGQNVEDNFFSAENYLNGEEYEEEGARTVMRALELCYSNTKFKITNEHGRSFYYSLPSQVSQDFIDDFYSGLQQLAYSPDAKTKGIWSIGKSSIDWYKALTNTDKLYRCAIIGAMTENFNKDQMIELYNTLMEHKTEIFRDWMGLKYVSSEFEQEYFSTAGKFWYHFSHGELDNYARRIYETIFNAQNLADCGIMTDAIHELAFQLAANDLSPDRLMLSAAGPLIEAGFNTLFAADDVAGYAKLGYDILNDNTQLVIDLKNGKLNSKTLMTAVNTNLNTLATCIDKVIGFDDITGIKDSQDLGSIISSFCVENGLDVTVTINDLNNVISETLTDMGKWPLRVGDLAYNYFEEEVKRILGLDAEFECPLVIISCNTDTYVNGVLNPFSEAVGIGSYAYDFQNVNVSRVDDSTLHFEVSQTDSYVVDGGEIYSDGQYGTEKSISFDIENFAQNKPERWVVTNLSVSYHYSYEGSGKYSQDWHKDSMKIGFRQLPFIDLWRDSYTGNDVYEFGGTSGDGINPTEFLGTNDGSSFGAAATHSEITYASNRNNVFRVTIQLVPKSR